MSFFSCTHLQVLLRCCDERLIPTGGNATQWNFHEVCSMGWLVSYGHGFWSCYLSGGESCRSAHLYTEHHSQSVLQKIVVLREHRKRENFSNYKASFSSLVSLQRLAFCTPWKIRKSEQKHNLYKWMVNMQLNNNCRSGCWYWIGLFSAQQANGSCNAMPFGSQAWERKWIKLERSSWCWTLNGFEKVDPADQSFHKRWLELKASGEEL